MLYIAYSFVEFVYFRHLLPTYRIRVHRRLLTIIYLRGGGGGHFLRTIKSLINVYATEYPVSLINQVYLYLWVTSMTFFYTTVSNFDIALVLLMIKKLAI
jgi:hypothetical protein